MDERTAASQSGLLLVDAQLIKDGDTWTMRVLSDIGGRGFYTGFESPRSALETLTDMLEPEAVARCKYPKVAELVDRFNAIGFGSKYEIAKAFDVPEEFIGDPIPEHPAAQSRVEVTAFAAGFRAGFESSREGFNGQYAHEHLAPCEGENTFDGLWFNDEAEDMPELKRLEDEAYIVWLRERVRDV